MFSKKRIRIQNSLAYTSLVSPVLECGAACWHPCREGQINALDRVQKKAAQFTNQTKDSDWETLAQRRTKARLDHGYIGTRTDTTQQSGQTPDKEVEIKNIHVYLGGYTETDTTGMLSPPTVWRFSVAADINSNVFDFYFLIWSLSRLLCCVGSGSNVAAALGPSYLVLLDFTTLSTT